MGKPHIIKTEAGEIVVLTKADYDALVRRAEGPTEAEEDAGTLRLVAESDARLARGEILIPREVVLRLDHENPIAVLREWRGLTQRTLADAVGIRQGYLSDLEKGRRRGTADLLARSARRLGVPLDL